MFQNHGLETPKLRVKNRDDEGLNALLDLSLGNRQYTLRALLEKAIQISESI